jgi:hypothetical protein
MIVLAILCGALVACYPVRSKPDVVGMYELKVGNGRISLDVASDQSFTETIRWASGKVEQRTGKWYWNRSSVAFDVLLRWARLFGQFLFFLKWKFLFLV